MASKRASTRVPSDSDPSTASSPYIPAPPSEPHRQSSRRISDYRRSLSPSAGGPPRRHKRRHHRDRGYSMSHEKHSSSSARLTLILAKYNGLNHHWRTTPVAFDLSRDNDIDLWSDIRTTFRTDLQYWWRRWFGFKRVKYVMPITYTPNMIPMKAHDPSTYPLAHAFLHAYHHPERLRPDDQWVRWFEKYAAENGKGGQEVGLQFVEGLWANKLAGVALLATVAIVVVSAVWCARGGNLQTVFTVMGFVLGGITAELALVALYFQISGPG